VKFCIIKHIIGWLEQTITETDEDAELRDNNIDPREIEKAINSQNAIFWRQFVRGKLSTNMELQSFVCT
jgi:hypothetical protein